MSIGRQSGVIVSVKATPPSHWINFCGFYKIIQWQRLFNCDSERYVNRYRAVRRSEASSSVLKYFEIAGRHFALYLTSNYG
ncbi:hypothetical protein JTE90_028264 [Oedothorax gibbosus]|uniref:Uncharacterized protein n=1 Tax=Oedothorax gibbosus TaxID=931172 RepID=A0AAV6UBK4_9ARAC|nr:hypothetical protein JTE90_028264 [Oedothorax gibbosus]